MNSLISPVLFREINVIYNYFFLFQLEIYIFSYSEQKNDVKEYCNLLVEELEKSFNMLEKNNSINYLCNIFLNNYNNFTNDYYDYINSSYTNSETVEKIMQNYIKGGVSVKENIVKTEKTKMKKEKEEVEVINTADNNLNSSANNRDNSYRNHMKNSRKKGNKSRAKIISKGNRITKKVVNSNNTKCIEMRGNSQVNERSNNSSTSNSNNTCNNNSNINSNSNCSSSCSKNIGYSNRGTSELKNFFKEEIVNSSELGFCDISFIPFIDNSFYINYGCIETILCSEELNSIFMIDNKMTRNNKDGSLKYKRLITFGPSGKIVFLRNVRKSSIVKGWICKSDLKRKCFFVKIFYIRNEESNDDKDKERMNICIEKKCKDSDNGDSCGSSNSSCDSDVYACLPFCFINKFEFLNDLNIEGIHLDNTVDRFVGMHICAQVFEDTDYIYTHFRDIIYAHTFHFFITFYSKQLSNIDKLGFLSKELNNDFLVEKKKNSKDNFLLKYFNMLLFSCRKFLNLKNLKYKEKFLLLDLVHMPSLIKFNYRNNYCQIHIGNIITKKQNLIWSNQKFLEAFEIYKNNSKYYNFLKSYFNLDPVAKDCKFVYVYEKDNFVVESCSKEQRASREKLEDTAGYGDDDVKNGAKDDKSYDENKEIIHKKNVLQTDENYQCVKATNKQLVENYEHSLPFLNDKENFIIKNIIFLNSNLYKTKWIYNFFNCIKLTINLNNQHILANFLLSLVLLELSCYTESFLFLFRIFKIKKMFLDSYKLKNIICSIFIKQLKKNINKEILWNVIINFKEYDLFNMREDNSEQYCRNIFMRNQNIISTLQKI
ncbi:conserved Plasmodium protein, unknown function [Plasmodium malariae]|uniref:Uncharacterized protein n=1 Tax=Plasmodium malariae TaxID=5858 RepID=A0A1C3KA01_PLAMA|nr:conserved Plasmodium protein, unknown function [Plasmodium malariae]